MRLKSSKGKTEHLYGDKGTGKCVKNIFDQITDRKL